MDHDFEETPQRPWLQFFLGLGGAMAIAVALVVTAIGFGGGEAHAADPEVTFSKSNGAVGATDVTWTIVIANTTNSSQVVQVSDSYEPNGTGTTLLPTYEGTYVDICSFSLNEQEAGCTLSIPANTTTTLTLHTSLPEPQCQDSSALNSATATVIGMFVVGSPDNGNSVTFPGEPGLCDARNVFQLCKQWERVGVLNSARSFTFNVSDSSEAQDFTISGVQEGGAPSCILLQAQGPITVTETVPSGFLSPDWELSSDADPGLVIAPNQVQFFLSSNECYVPTTTVHSQLRESISIDPGPDFKCTLTVTNRQAPEPSPSPTSPPTSCTTCVEPTSTPVRTATPTAVPPTTAPNTPVPLPTATPTTSSGVTDPSAVDAAKTAAAAITPLPPRTGDAQPAGSPAPLSMTIALIGLLTLGGGLAILGSRSRR